MTRRESRCTKFRFGFNIYQNKREGKASARGFSRGCGRERERERRPCRHKRSERGEIRRRVVLKYIWETVLSQEEEVEESEEREAEDEELLRARWNGSRYMTAR